LTPERPQGMRAFSIVWVGQVLSLVGSSMTGFALTIWAWEMTGSVTNLALVGFFNFTPQVIFSPIAGALVDRWNRKLVMALSDLAAVLSTSAILVIFLFFDLQIWHLYIAGAFSGFFQAFQWPAYSAAISTMIPKEHFARASGMMSLAEWGSGILSPALAGVFIGTIGIAGILILDILTFFIALMMLLMVVIPHPKVSAVGMESKGSLFKESLYGFQYILKRPSMLGLQLVFFFGNLLATIAYTQINPMILARTSDNAKMLALVQSVTSASGVAGSLLVTATGGPKRKILGVLGGWLCSGIGLVFLGMGSSPAMWIPAIILGTTAGPLINSSNQAIWQSKVPGDIQGKVFSVRRVLAQISAPVSMLIAGPLADKVTEPLMQNPQTWLSMNFGTIFGRSLGSGMGLIMTVCGLLVMGVAIFGASLSLIRNVETIIPDQVETHPE